MCVCWCFFDSHRLNATGLYLRTASVQKFDLLFNQRLVKAARMCVRVIGVGGLNGFIKPVLLSPAGRLKPWTGSAEDLKADTGKSLCNYHSTKDRPK